MGKTHCRQATSVQASSAAIDTICIGTAFGIPRGKKGSSIATLSGPSYNDRDIFRASLDRSKLAPARGNVGPIAQKRQSAPNNFMIALCESSTAPLAGALLTADSTTFLERSPI